MEKISLELAHAIAVWLEIFIYGIYTALLVSALTMLVRKTRRNMGAWIFLVSVFLMYAIATLHMVLALVRFLRAFILHKGGSAGPIAYMYDFSRADTVLDSTVYCVITWIADALVIYRCYYVWNKNYKVILLPVLLLTTSVGVNIYTLWYFTHLTSAPSPRASLALLNTIYPLALAQNSLTTALIAGKLYAQHRASHAHGVVDRGSRLSLWRVLRIVVESAGVYTAELLVLMVLYFVKSDAQVILQYAIVPSIGIVFILIAIRVHIAKSASQYSTGALGTIPAWLEDADEAIEFSTNTSLPRGVVSLRVSDADADADGYGYGEGEGDGYGDRDRDGERERERDGYAGMFDVKGAPRCDIKRSRSVKSRSSDSNTL